MIDACFNHFFCRWSEFIALLSLSTTFFLFLQTRDLSMQLSNEKMKNIIDGSTEIKEYIYQDREHKEEIENSEFNSMKERELFGKVIKMSLFENLYSFNFWLSLTQQN